MRTKIVNIDSEIVLTGMTGVLYAQKDILSAVEDTLFSRIIIQIASGGGCIASAQSLYYWLESLDTNKIEIHAFSHLASAANTFLLTKHPTYAYPHCTFMFHPCSSTFSNINVNNEQEIMSNNKRRVNKYWDLFIEKTGGKINPKWIKQKEHIYLYPQDLIDLKILDGVIGE